MDWSRWKGARGWVTWSLGWVCYHIYFHLPYRIQTNDVVMDALLPRAGDYMHWDAAMERMAAGD